MYTAHTDTIWIRATWDRKSFTLKRAFNFATQSCGLCAVISKGKGGGAINLLQMSVFVLGLQDAGSSPQSDLKSDHGPVFNLALPHGTGKLKWEKGEPQMLSRPP